MEKGHIKIGAAALITLLAIIIIAAVAGLGHQAVLFAFGAAAVGGAAVLPGSAGAGVLSF